MSRIRGFANFRVGSEHRFGAATDAGLIDLTDQFPHYPDAGTAIADGAATRMESAASRRLETNSFDEVVFDIPARNPEKIICVGINFPARNEEYEEVARRSKFPSLFVRFPRSFVGHGVPIEKPLESDKLDYEGEIAILLHRGGRRIPQNKVLSCIGALTLCNEGSVRDWLRHARFNVTQGKNFDRSGAMGPWLVPFRDRKGFEERQITTLVNGEIRQQDSTSRMLFPVSFLIAYISSFTTLVPGDVIVTGTPTGSGARLDPPVYLKEGDLVEIRSEGIGVLSNRVVNETP